MQASHGKASNPYQQLKYLYQTENYDHFFVAIDQLTTKLKENRDLKNSIFNELNYLQARISSTGDQIIDSKAADINHLNQFRILKDKHKLGDALAEQAADSTIDTTQQLRQLNSHLKKLLAEKLEYNRQLLELIDEYQQKIIFIIKNLYKLFAEQKDDLRTKAEQLADLKQKVIEEFNLKVLKLSKLSQLNDLLIP